MRKTIFISFLLMFTFGSYTAQNIRDTTIFAPVISATFAGQVPLGVLANRFGLNSNIGVNLGFKTGKNWQFEFEGNFLFSKNVKENTILDPILTSDRQVIAPDGSPVNIELYERGFITTFNVGKIFPVIGPNPNSGLIAKIGIGFIRHKIRIDNQDNLVPMLAKERLVYYDRMTMGLAVKQYIGYQHMGNTNLANFHIGIEFIQGFTQGMRDWQFDLEAPYRDKRVDLLIGLRVGWIFPVYRKAPAE